MTGDWVCTSGTVSANAGKGHVDYLFIDSMKNRIKRKLASMRSDHHLSEVMRGASSAFMIRVLGTILGFAVSVIIARMLGADGSGVYYLALSVATIAATIGRVGFDNTVVRFVALHASVQEWDAVKQVYGVAMKVVAAASLFLSAFLFLGAGWISNNWFNKPYMEIPLTLAAVSILPLSLGMIQAESLRGLKFIPASQWIKTVFSSLMTLLILYPLVKIWGANGAVAAFSIATVFTGLAAWALWRRAWRQTAATNGAPVDTQPVKRLFQSSWPLFGVVIAGLVMQQTATIFLGVVGTADEIGIYSVANRITALLLFPLIAMISILTPKFSEMYRQGDLNGLKRLARQSSRMLTFVSVPVAMIIAIASEWVLALFGPAFASGASILQVLLIGVVVNASTGAVSEILMMTGHEKDCRNVNFAGAAIVMVFCILLVPPMGGMGAAIGVTSGVAGKNLLMAYMVYRRLEFWPIALRL